VERLVLLSRKLPRRYRQFPLAATRLQFGSSGDSNLGERGVDLHDGSGTQERFRTYAADLTSVLGHADRVRPFEDDCVGLLSAEGRKSVEPLAAVTAPERTAAQHQSLLHLVAQAPWSDQAVLTRVRERVLPSITRDEPVQAWIIDDTGFPKKGSHSVGVARQYCGQLGKQDNCQVAVSLSVATHQGSLPVAYRLYLPKVWADDPARRAIAGVPDDVRFQTKPEIALQQLRQAVADGVPSGVALMDPAYGNDSKLRAGISELGLSYVAGILPTTMVWRPGEAPLPPASSAGRGRPGTRLRRDETHQPVSAKTLALELAADAWQQIRWRDGSNTPLISRFARWRVRPAHDDARRSEPAAEEWLLIEWPEGEAEPDHYWLSTLPADISLESMVDQAKMRWRIERDYLELKQEVGLGHYEGRGWRGFHHHATLCVAAYGFLISEKETIPPSGPACARRRSQSTLPAGCRPGGSAAAVTTPCAEFHRHAPYPPRAHDGAGPGSVPLLRPATAEGRQAERVTQ
jgi:SRSO17 transposase